MTANKENVYWKTKKEWYRINGNGEYELTEAAPDRARKSFALFCTPNPSQLENRKRLIAQLECEEEGFHIQDNTLLEYSGTRTTIDIPSGITTIRWFGPALPGAERKVIVPDTVTKIDAGAFSASGMSDIVLPHSLRSIGSHAFSGNMIKSIQIPPTVKTIQQRTFWKCKELNNLSLSEGLEEIESFAFAECSKLQRVVIPKSVKTIHSYAFHRCYALSLVIIQGNETEIALNAFEDLRNLMIVAPLKSYAIKYARNSGLRYREQ